jgi:hypothetical protein
MLNRFLLSAKAAPSPEALTHAYSPHILPLVVVLYPAKRKLDFKMQI